MSTVVLDEIRHLQDIKMKLSRHIGRIFAATSIYSVVIVLSASYTNLEFDRTVAIMTYPIIVQAVGIYVFRILRQILHINADLVHKDSELEGFLCRQSQGYANGAHFAFWFITRF